MSLQNLNGAILVNKEAGSSSFGVLDSIKRIARSHGEKAPKLGHGGTLDPFATGLLVVCIGRGVKLSRYFLGSSKCYEATLRFGETSIPGDPTDPISEKSEILPKSLAELSAMALQFKQKQYRQTPPMHSAKKKNGVPLYELARKGIEIEREPKLCTLHEFDFLSYESPRAVFRVRCSSGTYIRTLAQDFAKELGTVGMLDRLHRTESGKFSIDESVTLGDLSKAAEDRVAWHTLPGWVPFDRLLDDFSRVDADKYEAEMLVQGKQQVLPSIVARRADSRAPSPPHHIAIYFQNRLLAIAVRENDSWGLERVFPEAYNPKLIGL